MSNYEDMNYEELTEEQDLLITMLTDVKNALADLDRALNNLADVGTDVIGTDVINKLYDELEDIRNVLDEEKTGIEIDLEEIESQMRILEDTYDEYDERNREYREMQGF